MQIQIELCQQQEREASKLGKSWLFGSAPLWRDWAPTSRPSDDVTNGRVARELPVASALLIRRDVAQFETFVMFG
jgi:hypothetical protein